MRDKEKQKVAQKAHYQKYKDTYKARDKKVREQSRELIHNLKANKPCSDCGIIYPHYVMQFDHVKGEKLFNISMRRYNNENSKKMLLDEIDKCELVCANCHAARSFNRGQHHYHKV